MQFNSYEFILCFLPVTVLLYFLANRFHAALGKTVIIAGSMIFYALGQPEMLLYLGISILINYGSTVALNRFNIKNKWAMALPVVVNVGILLYFKYLNFAITNVNEFFGADFALKELVLPLGISFYTFQQIAYVVASERGELKNNSLIDYLAYILFFPKLVMGPIVDPADFMTQINDDNRKKLNPHHLASGIKLFSYGLLKKVLLADTFAQAVSWTYDNINFATSMDCMLLVLFYSFEIYFDFSGYSDMAVGISSMMNIDLPMNFDSPYKALSIRDFWKRWHISLTRFLTKYIYIPLGGSRKGAIFTYANVMTVFLVSGLWHGANWTFILWGFLHGLFCCIDRLLEKSEEKVFLPVRWLCSFGVVSVLWLLFSAKTVRLWAKILYRIHLMQDTGVSEEIISCFNVAENQFVYHLLHLDVLPESIRGLNMMIFILVACVICFIPENNYRNREKCGIRSMVFSALCFVWGLLCLGTESTFLYFGF